LSAWIFLRCIAGIASAWVLVSVSAWSLQVLAHHKRPFLNGLVFAGVGIGIALAGLICLLIIAVHGSAALAWISLGVLALLLMVLTSRSFKLPSQTADAEFIDQAPEFKWNTQSVWITIIYGLFGFGYIIPATFLPVMARNALPDLTVSGWSWPLFGTVAAISVLFTGRLAHRLGNLRLWGVSQIILSAGVVLPALFAGLLPVMLAALCVGGTFLVITLSAIQEARSVAPHTSGVLIAAMTSAFALGQIMGPLAVPFFSKRPGDFTLILLVSAALMFVGALILLNKSRITALKT
jgi:MFS family permease